ncbi:hypothetical protein AX15_003876 [Amanita polypyramis BW_CC]|nr:hypothetical protein AX15_003876 [Amanita polypyramis BW_CC]
MKRRYTVDSEEDDDYGEDEEYAKRPRMQQVDSEEEGAGEEEVDVDDAVDEAQSHAAYSALKKIPPSSKLTKHRLKQYPQDAQPAKKRRPLVASEPDTEDEYVDAGGDDDDFAVEPDRPPKGKGRAPMKVGKQSRGKMKTDVADIPIKDERRKVMAKASDATATGAAKRSRPKAKGEDDGVGERVPTPDTPAANLTHSPPSVKDEAPPPKKRKLPTIKKNKSAAPAGPATPSTTSTAAKPAPPPAPKGGSSLLDGSLLPPPTNTRKSAALAGQADFDLRNQDVYNALFKNTGGSTPRSGLSRREKNEERQRELNKMKEEMRAKRELEAVCAFASRLPDLIIGCVEAHF